MTRRERLMATLRGEPVDRPAVSFYEIGGWKILDQCDDPDGFNVYNGPSWRPLAQLAEERTDLIRMLNVPFASVDGPAKGEPGSTSYESWGDEVSRFTRRTVYCHDRELTSVSRRDADTMTTWTIEHLLKSIDDLKAYLAMPEAPVATEVLTESFLKQEAELGDAGIALIEMGDPICSAADLFSMEDYTITAMTEGALFHQLLERFARDLHTRTAIVAEALPGRLWRICGSEYASEPYLPPRLYGEYVGGYTGPMVDVIQKFGGYARIHSHGRLRNIMPTIMEMNPAGLDPCEPAPQGDMELSELRREYGKDMVLFGNLEASDLEGLPTDQFEQKILAALEQGTEGEGRGFVLMPSSCPYGREIPTRVLNNYEAMVRLAEGWGG
jgi:uroporphyrinogen-III decarboxylase